MFATSCSQRACQAQATWFCDAFAAAKHHLISFPKHIAKNSKKVPNVSSETLRMFNTFCSQRACQAQAAWLCDAFATAKYHLISFLKRIRKKVSKAPSETQLKLITLSLFSFFFCMFATSCSQRACQAQAAA
jgi:hypothetical protein